MNLKIEIMKTETLNWVSNEIRNHKGLVRTKKTQEKLIGFLEVIFNFSEENQTTSKKELTQMKNALDKVCSTYYSLFRGEDTNGEVFNKLAQNRGYENRFNLPDDVERIINKLQFMHVYGLHSIKHNLKKIEGVEFNSVEKDYLNNHYPNMEKWHGLHNKIESINSILNPTKEEKELRKLKEIKGAVNPKLKTLIDKIAEDFRKQIEVVHFERYLRLIDRFMEEHTDGVSVFEMRDSKLSWVRTITKYTSYSGNIIKLNPNAKELAAKDAKKESEEIILSWQIKMYEKLGGDFFSGLCENFTANVSGRNHLSNSINFNFENGASFRLQNQVVSKFSNRGTFFYTFPTTFHDAYLADGTIVKNPDEYNVKKAFQEFYENK